MRQPAQLPRLGFSIRETGHIIGRSYLTTYRLVKRGKLKANHSLRTPIISLEEIQRFLGSG